MRSNPDGLAAEIGERLRHPVAQSYERQAGDPPYRRLRIFTSDPVASRLEGRMAVALVPYEPLTLEREPQEEAGGGDASVTCPCLRGQIFELCMQDADGRGLDPPRLDDPQQLLQDGYV